jgi:rubrerythrin
MARDLRDSQTSACLRAAFAAEAQANRRYLYFARVADVEGQPDVANLFRATAEGETGHALGHLEYLRAVGDPVTALPIGNTRVNLAAAIAGETYEFSEMYVGFARTARDEGFEEIAEWFETLARAERSHAARFQQALAGLGE